MIALELALLLLPAQQPVETTQPAPVAPRRGMVDLQWNGPKVQLRHPEPVIDLKPAVRPVEPMQAQPRVAEPVLERRSHDLLLAVQHDLLLAAQSPQGRSWIGVELSSTGEGDSGIEVGRVIEASPAERAQFQPGDKLIALDGEQLGQYEDLRGRLDGLAPGTSVRLTIGRDAEIRLDQRGWGETGKPRLGVRLSEGEGRGLQVESVESGWPAEQGGLRAGDRLLSIGEHDISQTSDLTEVLAATEPGETVTLSLEREVELELGTFPDAPGQAPGGGAFQREVPEPGEAWTFERQAPQIFGLPHGGGGSGDFQPQPAPRAEEHPQGSALESELRSLRDELRSLREELRALRSELDELRRSSAGRGAR